MPIAHDFSQALLKVQRAERHLREVETLWSDYLKSDFCRLAVHRNAQGHDDGLYLENLAPVPDDIALAIGDTVHNLRSALDYATSDFMGGKNRRITFPMDETRDALVASFATNEHQGCRGPKSGRNAAIKQASPELADFIIDRIQPYRAGNGYLWAVGKFAATDKHRTLTPIVRVSQVEGVDVSGPFFMEGCTIRAKGDYFPFVMSTQGFGETPIKIENHGKPTAEILFGETDAFQNEPVIPTLLNMSQAVSETLSSLSEFLNRVGS